MLVVFVISVVFVMSANPALNSLFVAVCRGRKKPININILGGTVSGTNRNRPWDKWDRSPGQIGPRPWDKPAFFVEFHSKVAILSRLSLGRVGVRPWDDCPTKAFRKMFMCFLFIGFFRLQSELLRHFRRFRDFRRFRERRPACKP